VSHLPDEALVPGDLAMLTDREFAHFVTLNEDGSPHATPVWIDVDDDGNVLVNTAAGRRKHRNVLRDPRVAVSITAHRDPYSWVSIRGTVVSIEIGDAADEHIDRLNRRYHAGEAWKYVAGQERLILRIRPDEVVRSR
jgi:PPOX class probable F420-dependent enzyme